jgi:hypothetical protein
MAAVGSVSKCFQLASGQIETLQICGAFSGYPRISIASDYS